jgi:hypothetical protein
MTNIFNRPGMLDGHKEIQSRVSTPIIGVLRDLAIEAERLDRLDEGFSATELISFAEESSVDIPGIRGHDDEKKARWLGGQLGTAFKAAGGDTLEFDGYKCVRLTSKKMAAKVSKTICHHLLVDLTTLDAEHPALQTSLTNRHLQIRP